MTKSTPNAAGWQSSGLRDPGATPQAPHGEPLCFESLLAASAVPVMIVDVSTGRIEECNPAAARVFRRSSDVLKGSKFLEAFDSSAAGQVRDRFECARRTGHSAVQNVRAAAGGAVDLRFSLFRTEAAAYLLVHPAPHRDAAAAGAIEGIASDVLRTLHEAPIGFLVTDTNFRVEYANRVFLRMVNSRAQAAVRGQPIGRWLRMTAVHWARLGALLSGRKALEELSMILKCEHGAARGVSVAAVAVPHGSDTLWGFCVRELSHLH